MKRIKLFLLSLLTLAGLSATVFAATQQSPYNVAVTTIVANSSVNNVFIATSAVFPTIGGPVRIRKIYFSNDGAAERVSLWKNCGMPATATLIWDGVVPSSASAASGGNLNVDFLPDSINVSSVCVTKGLLGSGTIRVGYYFQ
jgi:hypothetical protein